MHHYEAVNKFKAVLFKRLVMCIICKQLHWSLGNSLGCFKRKEVSTDTVIVFSASAYKNQCIYVFFLEHLQG